MGPERGTTGRVRGGAVGALLVVLASSLVMVGAGPAGASADIISPPFSSSRTEGGVSCTPESPSTTTCDAPVLLANASDGRAEVALGVKKGTEPDGEVSGRGTAAISATHHLGSEVSAVTYNVEAHVERATADALAIGGSAGAGAALLLGASAPCGSYLCSGQGSAGLMWTTAGSAEGPVGQNVTASVTVEASGVLLSPAEVALSIELVGGVYTSASNGWNGPSLYCGFPLWWCGDRPLEQTVTNPAYLASAKVDAAVRITRVTASYHLHPLAPDVAVSWGRRPIRTSWTPPASPIPITGYRVYRNGVFIGAVDATATTYQDNDGPSGHHYYEVSAVSEGGEGPRGGQWGGGWNVPAPVRHLAASPEVCPHLASRQGTRLEWLPPAPDIDAPSYGYKVYRGTTPDSLSLHAQVLSLRSLQATWVDCDIPPGATYYYQLTTWGAAEDSEPSPVVSRTLPGILNPTSAPAAAGSLVATATSSSSVKLDWAAPPLQGTPVEYYKVWRKRSGDYGYRSHALVPATATSYDDRPSTLPLTPAPPEAGGVYSYQVTAVNAAGEGPPSNEATAGTPSGVPGAVPALYAAGYYKSKRDHGIRLEWPAPSSDGGSPVTGYRIERGTETGKVTPLTTVNADSAGYSDTTVTKGVRYYYRVAAVNANGVGAPSPETSAVAE